jgi:hypothetical protein
VAEQVIAYCVSAFASGTMFYRWKNMDTDGRQRVWRLYGWFSALMLCGSCIGLLTWLARMQDLVNNMNGNFLTSASGPERLLFFASTASWRAAFNVLYALEFLCLSAAELMVLERMFDFAISQAGGGSKRWMLAGRTLLAAVVLGNLVGLCGSIAAAARFGQAARAYAEASRQVAAESTDAKETIVSAIKENEAAFSIASVQSYCEVSMLLLIVASFIVVGAACARRVSATLHGIGAPAAAAASVAVEAGRKLRAQIVFTTAFVFAAFLLRSVYSTMYAVALPSLFFVTSWQVRHRQ